MKKQLDDGTHVATGVLVARLACEAQQRPFDYDALGLEIVPAVDPVVLRDRDTGETISAGQITHAATILLWTLVVDHAEATGRSPAEVVQTLGLGLATE